MLIVGNVGKVVAEECVVNAEVGRLGRVQAKPRVDVDISDRDNRASSRPTQSSRYFNEDAVAAASPGRLGAAGRSARVRNTPVKVRSAISRVGGESSRITTARSTSYLAQ